MAKRLWLSCTRVRVHFASCLSWGSPTYRVLSPQSVWKKIAWYRLRYMCEKITARRYKAVHYSRGPLHNKGRKRTHNLALLYLESFKTTSKFVFHHRSSSIEGCFPSKVVLHQRSHHPTKTPWLILYFCVSKVNILNLSLLPCAEPSNKANWDGRTDRKVTYWGRLLTA